MFNLSILHIINTYPCSIFPILLLNILISINKLLSDLSDQGKGKDKTQLFISFNLIDKIIFSSLTSQSFVVQETFGSKPTQRISQTLNNENGLLKQYNLNLFLEQHPLNISTYQHVSFCLPQILSSIPPVFYQHRLYFLANIVQIRKIKEKRTSTKKLKRKFQEEAIKRRQLQKILQRLKKVQQSQKKQQKQIQNVLQEIKCFKKQRKPILKYQQVNQRPKVYHQPFQSVDAHFEKEANDLMAHFD